MDHARAIAVCLKPADGPADGSVILRLRETAGKSGPLSTADRAEYRLVQADCHNFLARLALDSGDKDAARKEAGVARERARCDGPPHSYKPALDEADRLLAQL